MRGTYKLILDRCSYKTLNDRAMNNKELPNGDAAFRLAGSLQRF